MQKIKSVLFQKKTLVYLITIVLSILYVVIGNRIATRGLETAEGADTRVPVKAAVTKIISRSDLAEDGSFSGITTVVFEVRVTSGERKGTVLTATQQIDSVYPAELKEVEIGDKVLLYEDTESETRGWIMGEYVRFDPLLILAVLFGVGLLIFGRMKGINTIVSLAFTFLAVFLVFIPAVMSAQNIYFWSILTCIFITVMTLLIINGADRKSFAAGIGCFSGMAVSGLLTVVMDSIIRLTGWLEEDSINLYMLNPHGHIDLKAIIFASIIIGAIGAIMDVAMSVASALYELKVNLPNASAKDLYRSGITIGRDMMGTMANTLVLAYIGSSLSMTLLMIAYTSSLTGLLNREAIVVEILNALAGSIGILLTIPLTSFVCSVLYTRKKMPAAARRAEDDEDRLPEPKHGRPPMPEPKSYFSMDDWKDGDDYDGI